jgi:hypothetical protein
MLGLPDGDEDPVFDTLPDQQCRTSRSGHSGGGGDRAKSADDGASSTDAEDLSSDASEDDEVARLQEPPALMEARQRLAAYYEAADGAGALQQLTVACPRDSAAFTARQVWVATQAAPAFVSACCHRRTRSATGRRMRRLWPARSCLHAGGSGGGGGWHRISELCEAFTAGAGRRRWRPAACGSSRPVHPRHVQR